VTILVRTLDSGPRVERVWRLSSDVGEAGVRLRRDLPFEPGRPVQVELTLPDQDSLVRAVGVVTEVRPDPRDGDDSEEQDDRPRPRAIAFTTLDAETRQRLVRYVEERTFQS
jgi:hypothetical protein